MNRRTRAHRLGLAMSVLNIRPATDPEHASAAEAGSTNTWGDLFARHGLDIAGLV
jgi:hypothetical protein